MFRAPLGDGVMQDMESEPVNAQLVEWVGLVCSRFQFLTPLAAVFAKEIGGFQAWFLGDERQMLPLLGQARKEVGVDQSLAY